MGMARAKGCDYLLKEPGRNKKESLFIFQTNIYLCGLVWRARRPLQLEIADMREAKLEEGIVVLSFSSKSYEEAPSCGVNGGMVANRRVCCHAFVMDTGSGPEGSRLTVDGWRSQGSGVEKDFGGLAGSESVDRERARTNISLKKES